MDRAIYSMVSSQVLLGVEGTTLFLTRWSVDSPVQPEIYRNEVPSIGLAKAAGHSTCPAASVHWIRLD